METLTNTGGQTQPDGSVNFITDSDGFCKDTPTGGPTTSTTAAPIPTSTGAADPISTDPTDPTSTDSTDPTSTADPADLEFRL